MRCNSCGSLTRVINTEHRDDGTHRWIRCTSCRSLLRTLETYIGPKKPGPSPGTPRNGVTAKGSRNAASVLTENDVNRLRQLAADGVMQKELARSYGIAPATVSRIITRKTWTHI
jgi:hypothetical protein